MNAAGTTGIVLRTRPLTDSSLIVSWLTKDFGRLATVAKGARRPKSTFRGQIDLFHLAEFSFARSRRSELHTLREIRVIDANGGLRPEMSYLQQASYCAALIEQCTETDTPLPDLFEAFTGLVKELPLHPPQAAVVFAFELKLLDDLGMMPDLEQSSLSQGSRQLLERFAADSWDGLFRLKPSPAQTAEIRQFLHGFMIFHLGRIPKSRTWALGLE